MFFSTSNDCEDTMLELSEGYTLLPSDLSSFYQVLGTQTKSLTVPNVAQQEQKTQHTPSTNDKDSKKDQSALQQSLLA